MKPQSSARTSGKAAAKPPKPPALAKKPTPVYTPRTFDTVTQDYQEKQVTVNLEGAGQGRKKKKKVAPPPPVEQPKRAARVDDDDDDDDDDDVSSSEERLVSRVKDKKAKGKSVAARGSGGSTNRIGVRKAGAKLSMDDSQQPGRIASHAWREYPSDHRAAVDHLLAYVRPVTLEEMATVDVQVVTVKNPRFGHQFNVGTTAHFLFNLKLSCATEEDDDVALEHLDESASQRIVLQLPPLPTGLTLRARPDAPAGTVPSWSDVVPGPLGKFCVLKSGQVLYRLGDEVFEAFPGMVKKMPQELATLRDLDVQAAQAAVVQPKVHVVCHVEKSLVLFPRTLIKK